MPLHEYTCKKCSQSFELLVMSSTVVACPACGSDQLEKLISRPTPPGKSAAIIAAARARAEREGHFSNYRREGGKIVD